MKNLLTKNFKLYITTTGAGSGVINDLWKVPGCSSFLTGFSFPYHPSQTSELLGFTPPSFVSKEVSWNLAAHSFQEAWRCRENDDQEVIGVGATSSVASFKEHRGDHRVFVSVISKNFVFTQSAILHKGSGEAQREADGKIVDEMIEKAILSVLKINSDHLHSFWSIHAIKAHRTDQISDQDFLDHLFLRPFFKANGERENHPNSPKIFMPGHFNPFHWGHEGIGEEVRKEFGKNPVFTTIINPPHKKELTIQEILGRVAQMKGKDFLLTRNDPTFLEKARKNPGSTFVMGMDTLDRLLDEKWGHSVPEMLKEFKQLRTSFFVADRKREDGKVLTLVDLFQKRPVFGELFHQGPKIHYLPKHWDISSSELRNKES